MSQKFSGRFFKLLLAIRDHLWNYPETIIKAFKIISPFGYIGVLTILLYPIISTVIPTSKNPLKPDVTEIYEAYIGTISTINPLFETNNQIEKDIISLVYSPLFVMDAEGKLTYKLAKSYSVDESGKNYTFYLRQDVLWHDGNIFSADDVVYTFTMAERIKTQNISVRKVDDFTVMFSLPQPSPIFLETIILGIMPKHIWGNIEEGHIPFFFRNQEPIGTGPYKLTSFSEQQIVLDKNPDYFGCIPSIDRINIMMFPNETELIEELQSLKVTSVLNPPITLQPVLSQYGLIKYSKPIKRNTKVLFLNTREVKFSGESQVSNILHDSNIRRAIAMAINREELLTDISVDGDPTITPFDENSWAFDPLQNYNIYNPQSSGSLLDAVSWEVNPETGIREKNGQKLSLSITYLDNPQNESIAAFLQESLLKVGIELLLDPRDYSSLTQEIIPLRSFDLLLFEIETGLDPDCYAWYYGGNVEHPNLNLSGYSLQNVDRILEEARTTIDKTERQGLYHRFLIYYNLDIPIIYLYHPALEYYVSSTVSNIDLSNVTLAEDRFLGICNWEASK
ncbi:hypothetical protein JW962_00575 [Candidatus Dojkabacteria bacterium]|nr:hypothetical protein [Candidatus Dojkabacteria bacterium]